MSQEDLLNQPPAPDELESFFANTPTSEPAAPASQSQAGTQQVLDQEEIEAEIERIRAEATAIQNSPANLYLKKLEAAEIELEEARKIIDRLVVQLEPYEERVKLGSRLNIVFRTRRQEDTERLIQVLEMDLPQIPATLRTRIIEHNLAASLLLYGEKKFDHESIEDHQANLAWVQKLPQPVFAAIGDALSKFDEKIRVIFEEGWTENF